MSDYPFIDEADFSNIKEVVDQLANQLQNPYGTGRKDFKIAKIKNVE